MHVGYYPWTYNCTETGRGVSQKDEIITIRILTDRNRINVSFIDKDGEKYDFQVAEGDNLLDIAQANDLEMEGGFCAVATQRFSLYDWNTI